MYWSKQEILDMLNALRSDLENNGGMEREENACNTLIDAVIDGYCEEERKRG